MIVAGYVMHIYCDEEVGEDHPEHSFHRDTKIGTGWGEYCEKNWTACVNMARKDGWLIGKNKQRAICPDCRQEASRRKGNVV